MWSHNTHKYALPAANKASKNFDWLRAPFKDIAIGEPMPTLRHTADELSEMGMVGIYTDVKPHRPEYRMITTI